MPSIRQRFAPGTARIDATEVPITLLDSAVVAGGAVSGFVANLDLHPGPYTLQYTCVERFLSVMFYAGLDGIGEGYSPESVRTLCSMEVQLHPGEDGSAFFTLELPSDVPPNAYQTVLDKSQTFFFDCRHVLTLTAAGSLLATQKLIVVDADSVAVAHQTGDIAAETMLSSQSIWTLPRVSVRKRAYSHSAHALFTVTVPRATCAVAGRRLFMEITSMAGVKPRALKFSIARHTTLKVDAGGYKEGTAMKHTVQHFQMLNLSRSFEGTYYIVVPSICCTLDTALLSVTYTLKVKLKFGFGRYLKQVIPITVLHCRAAAVRSDFPLLQTEEWNEVIDIVEARQACDADCPICFERLRSAPVSDDACKSGPASPLWHPANSCCAEEEGVMPETPVRSVSEGQASCSGEHTLALCIATGTARTGSQDGASTSQQHEPACTPRWSVDGASTVLNASSSGRLWRRHSHGASFVHKQPWVSTRCVRAGVHGPGHDIGVGIDAPEPAPTEIYEAAGGQDAAAAVGGTAGGAVADDLAASTASKALGMVSAKGAMDAMANTGHELLVTTCGHVFHCACLLDYERFNGRSGNAPARCPVCRETYSKQLLNIAQARRAQHLSVLEQSAETSVGHSCMQAVAAA